MQKRHGKIKIKIKWNKRGVLKDHQPALSTVAVPVGLDRVKGELRTGEWRGSSPTATLTRMACLSVGDPRRTEVKGRGETTPRDGCG